MTTEFTHPISFGELNDTEVDALWSVDSDGNVSFESCKLGDLSINSTMAMQIIGRAELARQEQMAAEWWDETADDDWQAQAGYDDAREARFAGEAA